MKKLLKSATIFMMCISFAGCSGGKPETESESKNATVIPTLEVAESSALKSDAMEDSLPPQYKESFTASNSSESKQSENNSWEYISSIYPFVSYDDVKAGKYNNQYVILSAIIENTDYSDLTKWLECDVWFLHDDSYICDNITFDCKELPEYSPTGLNPGDNIDVCFYINADSSFGSKIKAYSLNSSQLTLEDIYSSFSENADLWSIDFEYCGVVKNDTTKNWRFSKVYTDFDAVDYALYYYKRYFQSDDEIHAIINYSNNTTVRIRSTLGMLDVSVLSHIDGEENDAKILFSGDVIQDYMISIESGELVNIEE